MKRYQFVCDKCRSKTVSASKQRPFCDVCGAMMRRDWSAANISYHPTKGAK